MKATREGGREFASSADSSSRIAAMRRAMFHGSEPLFLSSGLAIIRVQVMWKIIHKVTTGLVIALGFVHLTFTAMEYASFSLDALWFLGSGLAIVYAGFLNVAVIRCTGDDRMVRVLGLIANLLLAGLFAATLSLMRPPQVFVGLALFVIAAVCVLARSRR